MVIVTATGPAEVGDHLLAHARQQPLGGDRHIVDGAFAKHDAEPVAGIAAERILAAHQAANAFADRMDHLIGDVEAVRTR